MNLPLKIIISFIVLSTILLIILLPLHYKGLLKPKIIEPEAIPVKLLQDMVMVGTHNGTFINPLSCFSMMERSLQITDKIKTELNKMVGTNNIISVKCEENSCIVFWDNDYKLTINNVVKEIFKYMPDGICLSSINVQAYYRDIGVVSYSTFSLHTEANIFSKINDFKENIGRQGVNETDNPTGELQKILNDDKSINQEYKNIDAVSNGQYPYMSLYNHRIYGYGSPLKCP